jgi:hypothetical protein
MAVADRHPDAERLAAYVDDRLTAADRVNVERHLAECEDCRAVVADTMDIVSSEPSITDDMWIGDPFRNRRLVTGVVIALAAAAVLVLAIRIVRPEWLPFGPRGQRPELQELFAALANEPTRPVEGRLTGGLEHKPEPSPTRGPGDRETSLDATIAAAEIKKKYGDRRSADARAAVGIADLVTGDLDRAIERLQQAVQQAPDRAAFHSDLSVALIERARRRHAADDWPLAVAEAERALALHANLPEALFNRALALEGLRRTDQADAAWSLYLRTERDRAWAAEAERRRQR